MISYFPALYLLLVKGDRNKIPYSCIYRVLVCARVAESAVLSRTM